MEHAPLRPVPSRPRGWIDPATAVREVGATLPALSPLEARAFALVALAQRPRAGVAALLDVDEPALASALASARKELRRTVASLPGSGWCERAERLISDRLDATLTGGNAFSDRDAARLDAHLRNCPRCVEHERRLVQATDSLVLGLAPGPTPAAPEPPTLEPAAEPPALEPAAEPPALDATTEPPALGPTASQAGGGEAPAAAPSHSDVAAAADVLVAVRTRRQIAAAVTWNAMIAIAILLTLATIALTIAGIMGAEL